MKPTKSVVYCNNCYRKKILFDTEKSAENFMKFNNNEIEFKSGYSPKRSYYCVFCLGWHITSKKDFTGLSKNEIFVDKHTTKKAKRNIKNIDKSQKIGDVKNELPNNSEQEIYFSKTKEEKEKKINERYIKSQELENKIEQMTYDQKEVFFSENINIINTKIELLLNSEKFNRTKLKKLREELTNLYIFRKKYITIIKK